MSRRFFRDPFFNDPFFEFSDPFAEFDRRMARLMRPLDLWASSLLEEPQEQQQQQQGEQGDTRLANTSQDQTPAPASTSSMRSVLNWAPRTDVSETDNAIIVRTELPGMNKQDVKVEVIGEGRNRVLNIEGESKREQREEKENYLRTERAFGRFQRQFRIPKNVKVEELKAKMENGVLELQLPKVPVEEQKPKVTKIEID